MHGTTVVAEQGIVLCEQRGQLRDAQALVYPRHGLCHALRNCVDQMSLVCASDQRHAGDVLRNDTIQNRGEIFLGPQAKFTAASRMHQQARTIMR